MDAKTPQQSDEANEREKEKLYSKIGQLHMELEFLKKNLSNYWGKSTLNRKDRIETIDSTSELSQRKQCELLSVHRSGLYYKPKGESSMNLHLMRIID